MGLAVYLLGIETSAQVERDPLFGNLFENMIISDIYKKRLNEGKDPGLYFFRDHHQNEIDLLYPNGSSYVPIEIKSSKTYREGFLKNVKYLQKLMKTTDKGILIYDGDLEIETQNVKVTNFRNLFSDDF